eukprot:scaffold1433_cov178-Pinguiococcus_pyrenoidosus.AAC.5
MSCEKQQSQKPCGDAGEQKRPAEHRSVPRAPAALSKVHRDPFARLGLPDERGVGPFDCLVLAIALRYLVFTG